MTGSGWDALSTSGYAPGSMETASTNGSKRYTHDRASRPIEDMFSILRD